MFLCFRSLQINKNVSAQEKKANLFNSSRQETSAILRRPKYGSRTLASAVLWLQPTDISASSGRKAGHTLLPLNTRMLWRD
jgi:hypothetical protein